jgi:UPF0288 family protein (methanogenesis marker protein 3)
MEGMMLDDNHELQIDVKRDANGLITSGVVIGDITFQNQELIIACEKGEIREAPDKGVGAANYVDDEEPDDFLKAINIELTREGMKVNSIGFNEENKLDIDAKYKS